MLSLMLEKTLRFENGKGKKEKKKQIRFENGAKKCYRRELSNENYFATIGFYRALFGAF